MLINRSDSLAWFPFEGNVTNYGGATNGTVSGTEQYIDSLSGRGFDFNNSTSISMGNSGVSNSQSFTILLRINLDALSNGDRLITKSTGASEGWQLLIANSATTFTWRVRNSANTANLNDNITAVTSFRAIMVYVDFENDEMGIKGYDSSGALSTDVNSSYTEADYPSNAHNITIGGLSGGGSESDGIIDEVVYLEGILTDEDFYRYYLGMGITDL